MYWFYCSDDLSGVSLLKNDSISLGSLNEWLGTGAQNSDNSDPTTIFVKGFSRDLGEDDVRQQLTETFQECGAISSVRLPTDRETGALKGIAFIEFASPDGKVCIIWLGRSCFSVDDCAAKLVLQLGMGRS